MIHTLNEIYITRILLEFEGKYAESDSTRRMIYFPKCNCPIPCAILSTV